jgi:hypothetical protein
MSCISCLASLQVAFTNHGLNTELIAEFLQDSIHAQKQEIETLAFEDRLKRKITLYNVQMLLSLIERTKART